MGYSTDIKLDLMVTGSNSGTWGTKTNTNLQLIEEALCGYIDQSIAGGAGTTALVIRCFIKRQKHDHQAFWYNYWKQNCYSSDNIRKDVDFF